MTLLSGSIIVTFTDSMANAMLQEEFRSSHEDLMTMYNNALAPPPRLSSQFQHQDPPESPRKVEFVNLPPPPKRFRPSEADQDRSLSIKSIVKGSFTVH